MARNSHRPIVAISHQTGIDIYDITTRAKDRQISICCFEKRQSTSQAIPPSSIWLPSTYIRYAFATSEEGNLAQSEHLILSIKTLVSPDFHVLFDEYFQTIPNKI